MRLPKHIGIIPDGNRRWAADKGMTKEKGYSHGISPGLELFKMCSEMGVAELSYYGFTADNTKRPKIQRHSFTDACIEAVELLSQQDAELLVLGNYDSKMFPEQLKPFTERKKFGSGKVKVNFLVNYSWEWDLGLNEAAPTLKSADVSRVDLVIRWGGRQRLSGFLPVQSVYADFYFIDDYWPDFKPSHLTDAIKWYSNQDVTLGG